MGSIAVGAHNYPLLQVQEFWGCIWQGTNVVHVHAYRQNTHIHLKKNSKTYTTGRKNVTQLQSSSSEGSSTINVMNTCCPGKQNDTYPLPNFKIQDIVEDQHNSICLTSTKAYIPDLPANNIKTKRARHVGPPFINPSTREPVKGRALNWRPANLHIYF